MEQYTVSEGNYQIVAWDMIATGGNLSDDICQLLAYTPDNTSFSQHVMPYNNVSVSTRRRHSLDVINTGRYRVLKDLKNNKILRTKSCYLAVCDFLEWLNMVKGSSDGVLLMCHDSRRLIPCILLEVVCTYNLMERFCELVRGFINCYDLAEQKAPKTVKPHSIRSLCTLLPKEESLSDVERTKLIYDVAKQILEGADFDEELKSLSVNIDGMMKQVEDLRATHVREDSLQPLFSSMKSSRSERQRGINLQRLLARANMDYDILTDIYKKGGLDSITDVLKCTLAQEHARQMDELKHVFALHFDPEYKGQWKPERPNRPFRRNSRSRRSKSKSNNSESKEDNKTIPEVVVTDEKNDTVPQESCP